MVSKIHGCGIAQPLQFEREESVVAKGRGEGLSAVAAVVGLKLQEHGEDAEDDVVDVEGVRAFAEAPGGGNDLVTGYGAGGGGNDGMTVFLW